MPSRPARARSVNATVKRSWVEQIMGLPISILARGPDTDIPAAKDAVDAVYTELREVDRLFSPYRADSAVSRLARFELTLADCPPQVQFVADACDRAQVVTGGLFDAWRPDGRWDPSGYVKGWAVERAARHLAGVPRLDWCLNAGGDVAVVCPSGNPFWVGIQDPHHLARIAASVPSVRGGVATSGAYARGQHIYDPRSSAAPTGIASVTVIGPSLTVADVLATAAFVASDAALGVVASVPGYAALVIGRDAMVTASPGWPGSTPQLPY